MTLHRLTKLREQYSLGVIDREEYWQSMRTKNIELRAYEDLLTNTYAKTIEITENGMFVKTRDGAIFEWNPENQREACSIVINHGDYEPEVRKVLVACAKETKYIVDIGANVGWYTILLSLRGGADTQVVAFEPNPLPRKSLNRNVYLNNLQQQVDIVGCGLSSERQSADLYVPENSGHPAASLQNLHPEEQSIQVPVNLSTLDIEIEDRTGNDVGLIKCDVEGAELHVLNGGKRTIEQYRPIILLELLRKWSSRFGYHPNDVVELLKTYEYDCYAISTKGIKKCDLISNNTIETNFVFLHRDRDQALSTSLKA